MRTDKLLVVARREYLSRVKTKAFWIGTIILPLILWGLGSLAIATAAFVLLGWQAALQRRFADHERWMWRTYMLLISAIVIRMIGGAATVAGVDAPWLYPFSAWASWLLPLMVFEAVQLLDSPQQRVAIQR